MNQAQSMIQRKRRITFVTSSMLLSLVGVARADAPPGYYDTVDANAAATLRSTLHAVIDDHNRFPYTSSGTDTWNILELADEDPNNTGNILDIYRNATYPKAGGGNSNYNREHTWPTSYGFPNDNSSNYPYTDCHHLFLSDDGYNSSRSNKPFRYCDGGCSEKPTDFNNGQGGGTGVYPGNSNWTTGSNTSGTWEVWTDRRGDIARAQFYLDIRYEGGIHGGTSVLEPDLVLTDSEALIASSNTGSNEAVAYMGMLTVLLQWHLEDPVDSDEMARNDVIFSFQGNRNPFVDHPEWAECLFNDVCGSGCVVDADCDDGLFCNGVETCSAGICNSGTDPCPGQSCDEVADSCVTIAGDPWINEFHYDNSGSDTGEFVEIAGPAGQDLTGWSVVGYNGNGGSTYKTVNLSGIIPDQGGCMGTLDFNFTSMQNGAPDGLALVDDGGAVIEFISYEGAFTAVGGPANGMASVNIGVSESSSTPIGDSLQLSGTGAAAADFGWMAPTSSTRGTPNTGQTLDGCGGGCTIDADCDDGLFCNGAETCSAGSCQPGTPVDCDDGVACTADSCNEATDSCDNITLDGNCDDGLYCNGSETCDAIVGCLAGTPVNCDDGVACTDDSCNEGTDSCDNSANDGTCDDGLFCNGAETCDAVSDCLTGTPVNCDDGVACTDDSCNEGTDSCDNIANDGNCDDGLFCNGAETCDPIGDCQAGSDPCPGQSCDEGTDTCLDCTIDADCDDGVFCNGNETCVAGSCQAGVAVDCNDGVACTDDSCNEGTDSCDNITNDGNCDDGLYCNGSETCDPVSDCLAGTPVNCDDGVGCTDDSCNEGTDSCDNSANNGNCDDGLYCNGSETCDAVSDCLAGTPVNCDDGVACTDDSCNESTDSCDNLTNDGNCDDGLFCNGAETCDPISDCQAGGDPCGGGPCDEALDQCSGPVAQLEGGALQVDGAPTTVALVNAYISPVVVCSIQYDNNTTPVVTRVTNVTATSFDVYLQSPSGAGVVADWVSYLVVEEGVWTIDGVDIEAQTYLSTVTAENNNWSAEAQSYGQGYTSPVVIGQVMSVNDPAWSVFWCRGTSRSKPPSSTSLFTGKTVCEDPSTSRAAETIGFIVVESGFGTIAGVDYEAAVGADTIRGVGNSPPYAYSFNAPFSAAPAVGMVTQAGMDGGNGGWAYSHGPTMATTTTLFLSIDEDQVNDSERKHTTEQVGYVVFENPVVYP